MNEQHGLVNTMDETTTTAGMQQDVFKMHAKPKAHCSTLRRIQAQERLVLAKRLDGVDRERVQEILKAVKT